jgi:glycosyltransferase involved in cell wall biosynthesis
MTYDERATEDMTQRDAKSDGGAAGSARGQTVAAQRSAHIVVDARGRQSSSGRYIDRLIEHLQNIDTENRYTVLLKPGDEWQPRTANFSGVACKYKQFSFNPLDQITFARFLSKLKPDLVHFWMTPQEPYFFNGRRVTTVHDLTMFRFTRAGKLPLPLHWLRMAGYRWLFRSSVKKARHVLVPTQYVRQALVEYEPSVEPKATVTYEASEPPLVVESEQPEKIQEPFILYVGSAFPHKNLETLLQAFEISHSSQPELKLVLAGKREYYYGQLEKLADKSPARDSIIFAGFVSDPELKWLYEHAKAYVFPSLSEGFGLPGLEAMAHHCPVLSSDATCLPEVYQDAAVYFDPTSPEDIAGKIELILNHPTLANELKIKGEKVLERYSWEKMARETLAVYQGVLNDQA